jgi:hypothetical protein
MHTRAALLPVLSAAGLACAQAQTTPPITVTYHLTWIEASAAAPYAPVPNPNGILEPGEGARFAINASFDPGPGTPVTFPATLNPGSAGSGVIGGVLSGNLDLVGDNGAMSAAGSWVLSANSLPPLNPTRLGTIPPFHTGSFNGTVNAAGTAVADISPHQFQLEYTAYNSASPTPVMWRGLWLPSSFEPRAVSFHLQLGSLGLATRLFVLDDAPFPEITPVQAFSAYTSTSVPIIPAPPSLAAVFLAAIAAARRERPPSACDAT